MSGQRRTKDRGPRADTWMEGPRLCGGFDGRRQACHDCIAYGKTDKWICFRPPQAGPRKEG